MNILACFSLVVTIFVVSGCNQERSAFRRFKYKQTHTGVDLNGNGSDKNPGPDKSTPRPEPDCIKLTDDQTKLLTNPFVVQSDKNRLISAIFRAIKGKACPGVIAYLNSIYKNDPTSDHVNATAKRLENLRPKDVVGLAISSPELPLDADVLWGMATDLQITQVPSQNKVVVTGRVRYRRQSVELFAGFDSKDFKYTEITAEKMAELTKGMKVEFKVENNKVKGTTLMVEKEESPLKVFDEVQARTDKRQEQFQKKASEEGTRLNFTSRDLDVINDCGAAQTSALLRNAVKESGMNITINGMSLSANDEFSPEKTGKDQKALVDELIESEKKFKATEDGFYIEDLGEQKLGLLSQTVETDIEFNGLPSVKRVIKLYLLKLEGNAVKITKKENDGHSTQQYRAEATDEDLVKEIEVVMDGKSAYWFHVRTQRIQQCLVNMKYADSQASLGAVQSALLYILFGAKFSGLLGL